MKLNIKDKLESKNMSRYELAKRIGVTYPTITSIYNGDSTSIKLEILESICRELDCTPNEIIVSDDKNIRYSIEIEKLSSELLPIILESRNCDKLSDLRQQERFARYIDLLQKTSKSRHEKDDTD